MSCDEGWDCRVCDRHIDADHYNDVHTDPDGEDVCWSCCIVCRPDDPDLIEFYGEIESPDLLEDIDSTIEALGSRPNYSRFRTIVTLRRARREIERLRAENQRRHGRG